MKGLIIGLAIGLAVSFVMIHQSSKVVVNDGKVEPKGPTYEELVDTYIATPSGELFNELAYSLGGMGEPGMHSIEYFAHAFNRLPDKDLLMMLFDFRSAWDPDTQELIDALASQSPESTRVAAAASLGLTSEDARVVQTCYVKLVARMLNSDSSAISYLLKNPDLRSCREHAFQVGDKHFVAYPLPEPPQVELQPAVVQ